MTRNHNAMIGPKALPNPRRAQRLDGEERDQDHYGGRQDVRAESRRDDVEPFECRKNRDRRRDRAVAIDQRRPEQPYRYDHRTVLPLHAEKRHERQYSALAVIVDPHRERYVFDRRHDDQRPDHQRQRSERGDGIGIGAGEAENRLERVKRARADVAEHYAQCRKAERRQARGDYRPSLVQGRALGQCQYLRAIELTSFPFAARQGPQQLRDRGGGRPRIPQSFARRLRSPSLGWTISVPTRGAMGHSRAVCAPSPHLMRNALKPSRRESAQTIPIRTQAPTGGLARSQ